MSIIYTYGGYNLFAKSIDPPPCSNPGQALCRMASPCSATVTSEGRGPSCCGLFPLPCYTATSWQKKNKCNDIYHIFAYTVIIYPFVECLGSIRCTDRKYIYDLHLRIYIYIICVCNSVLFLILNTFIIFNILIGFTSIHLSHMPRIYCWCASILEIFFGCFTTRWRNRLGGIVRNIQLQTAFLLLGFPEFLGEAEIWDLSWSWWWGCWHHFGWM